MAVLFKNATIFYKGKFQRADIVVDGGSVVSVCEPITSFCGDAYDCSGMYIFPGFADVHVHFREPGFSYKETIKSGSSAAAHGGYTAVCTMPNLKPAPDNAEHLKAQTDIINRDAVIGVYPYGTISAVQMGEELSDMPSLSDKVIAFSDDGRGVQSDALMEKAMIKAKELNKIIAAHCEVNELLNGGYIHDGEYAAAHSHKGISSESEYAQIARDIALAEKTGVKYHVCHISSKESVELIRTAKAKGIDISCETAPHYLVFNDMQLLEDGRFKMNPPIRSEEDRLALIAGIIDGTVDMIATDHAPHSAEEKGRGLEKSLMGIVGLETAFPVMYTELVKTGIISLEKLIELMSIAPAKRFGLETEIEIGKSANFCIYDLDCEYTVNPQEFYSMGRATPFLNRRVFGKCCGTVYNGSLVFSDINERIIR